MRLTYALTIVFDRYIAEPYWPEMAQIIDIQKKSGMNRAKSDANRRKSLEEYLKSNRMTLAEYEAIEAAAHRPFHVTPDGEIIIPGEKILHFLVHTCDTLRAAQRPCPPDQVRSRFQAGDFATGKREPDGIWERFAVVSAGTGQKLSNQRGLRRSAFIRDFTARGRISFDADFVKPSVLRQAIAWAGDNLGMGASRKMGWGRFRLEDFTVADEAAAV